MPSVEREPLKYFVRVHLPGPLLRLFPDASATTNIAAVSIREMLAELDLRWPGMRDRLADTTPRIRRHISIFVDGHRATLDTQVRDGQEIYILTAISGG